MCNCSPGIEIDFEQIQKEHKIWEDANFGEVPAHQPLLGVVEEWGELNEEILKMNSAVGRLSHSHLKNEQGIRVNEDHIAKAKDAIGDISLFLVAYCNKMGWNYSEIVNQVWGEVSVRDWKKNKENGSI